MLDYKFLKSLLQEAIPLKESSKRRILKANNFLLKGFRKNRYPFLSNGAEKEFQIAQILSQKGITPKVWGIYEENSWKWVVFDYLKDFITLEEFLKRHPWPTIGNNTRKVIIKKLAYIIASLWESSILQTDIHPNNLLINPSNPQDIKLIDFHRANLKKRDKSLILNQLAYLLPPFQENIPFSTKSFFIRYLMQLLPKEIQISSVDLQKIIEKSYKLQRRYWRKFKRRLLRRKMIKTLKRGNIVLQYNSNISPQIYNFFLTKDFKERLTTSIINTLKRRPDKEIFLVKIEKDVFWIKKEKGIKTLFRRKLYQTWWNHWRLKIRNIPSPEPLIFIKVHRASYLLTKIISEEFVLLKKALKSHDSYLKKDIPYLAKLIWDMHQKGIIHGDLKASNIFWNKKQKFILVDLEDVKESQNVSFRKCCKDLIPLLASFEDHFPQAKLSLLFLNTYFNLWKLPKGKRIKLTKQIFNEVEKTVTHRRKRRGEI